MGTPPGQDGQAGGDVPVVYMTTDISAERLMAVYEALGASPSGNIAVKLSTGEPGSNYLRTDLIGELVQSLDADHHLLFVRQPCRSAGAYFLSPETFFQFQRI